MGFPNNYKRANVTNFYYPVSSQNIGSVFFRLLLPSPIQDAETYLKIPLQLWTGRPEEGSSIQGPTGLDLIL